MYIRLILYCVYLDEATRVENALRLSTNYNCVCLCLKAIHILSHVLFLATCRLAKDGLGVQVRPGNMPSFHT